MRLLILLSCLVAAACVPAEGPVGALAQQAVVVAEPGEARPIGGATARGDGSLTLDWPGSGAVFQATGTELTLRFESTGKTRVRVDVGEAEETLTLTGGASEHRFGLAGETVVPVRVRRLTGRYSGDIVVTGMETDGAIYAAPKTDRSMLIIGDSISVGYGVDGADQSCGFSVETENHSRTYGALAGDALGAAVTTVAISGRGLVRSWGDADAPVMPEVWVDVREGVDATPDVVVVNLGTNDFGNNDPGAAFDAAYGVFLDQLRAAYPAAEIYAATGPMLPPDVRAKLDEAVDGVVAAHNGEAARPAHVLSFSMAASGRRYGCDWHPGRDTQAGMAQILIDRLEADLGWSGSD